MRTVLSYGGGVNSTAILVHYDRRVEAVYVDHQGDHPRTREFVRWMRDHEGYNITIIEPDVEGFNSLYDFCMAKKVIPSRQFRWCTHKFKILPMTKYLTGELKLLIGFCDGEQKRIKSEFRFKKGITGQYPLVHDGIDRQGCIQIIEDAGLPNPGKSCCFFCPFMRPSEAREMYLKEPELYAKCRALEANCMRTDLFIGHKPIQKYAWEGVRPLEEFSYTY